MKNLKPQINLTKKTLTILSISLLILAYLLFIIGDAPKESHTVLHKDSATFIVGATGPIVKQRQLSVSSAEISTYSGVAITLKIAGAQQPADGTVAFRIPTRLRPHYVFWNEEGGKESKIPLRDRSTTQLKQVGIEMVAQKHWTYVSIDILQHEKPLTLGVYTQGDIWQYQDRKGWLQSRLQIRLWTDSYWFRDTFSEFKDDIDSLLQNDATTFNKTVKIIHIAYGGRGRLTSSVPDTLAQSDSYMSWKQAPDTGLSKLDVATTLLDEPARFWLDRFGELIALLIGALIGIAFDRRWPPHK